jgi:hypothetical protein
MTRGFFTIDKKYIVETTNADELMMGILAEALEIIEFAPTAKLLARMLTGSLMDIGETSATVQEYEPTFNAHPYRLVEIDMVHQTILDEGELETFSEFLGRRYGRS